MQWTAFGYLINLAGLIVALKLLTSILGPTSFGQYALGQAIVGVIQVFFYGPISQAVLRFFSINHEENKLKGFFSFLICLHVKVAILIASGAGIASLFVYSNTEMSWVIVVISAAVAAIFSGINATLTSIYTANRDRVIVAIYQGVAVMICTFCSVAGISVFPPSGWVALVGHAIGVVLIFIFYYLYFKKSFNLPKLNLGLFFEPNSIFVKQFHLYATPFVFLGLLGSVVNYGDRWIVQGIFSEELVGIYTALFQIANTPMSLFGTVVAQYVLPILFSSKAQVKPSKQHDHFYLITMSISGLCLVLGVLFSYSFSEFLLSLLTSAAFAQYHNVLWVITLGCALFQFAQLSVIRGLVELRPQVYVVAKAIHAFSFLIIITLIGNRYSLMGVALAISMSSLLYLSAIVVINRKSDNLSGEELSL